MAQVVTQYLIRYLDQTGVLIGEFDQFISLDMARGVNKTGWITVRIPASILDYASIKKDNRLEIRRKVDDRNYYTEGQTQWFIRKWRQDLSSDGKEIITLAGPSALAILDGYIVAYNAGTSYTAKTGKADDVMKEIVDENIVNPVDPQRTNDYLTVEADNGDGPTISKAFTRKNVLETLTEISDMSAELGTRIYFDVVSTGTTFQFRTYTVRGVDRTTGVNRVLVSPEMGNLSNAYIEIDRSEEDTVGYAGGEGTGAGRAVETYIEPSRSIETPFNWLEIFVNSTNSGSDTTRLQNEAKEKVYAARPKVTLGGEITQTADFRYGVEWGRGDFLPFHYAGLTKNVMVNNVRITVSDGRETITPEYLEVD